MSSEATVCPSDTIFDAGESRIGEEKIPSAKRIFVFSINASCSNAHIIL
jgi:hypothetical protein